MKTEVTSALVPRLTHPLNTKQVMLGTVLKKLQQPSLFTVSQTSHNSRTDIALVCKFMNQNPREGG